MADAEIFYLDCGDWVYNNPGKTYFAYCEDGSLYLEFGGFQRSVCLDVNETRILRNLLSKEVTHRD